jgi:long-chain fatty acid transport protein
MGNKKVIFFVAFFMIFGSCYLEASEFRKFELSARAATLGGAFAARADDVSAVFYNPAGLAFLTGFRLKTNIYYQQLKSTAEFPGIPETYKSTPNQIRGSHFISLNIKERFGFGIGGFTPNSMDLKWPANWIGNILSIHSKLNTFYIRPVVAVKISNHLAVGVGLDFIFSDVAWVYNKVFTFQEIGLGYQRPVNSESKVSGKGLGFVAGVMVRISDNLRIGGRYQPKVKLDFEGSHYFSIYLGSEPPILANREVTSTLTMPQEFVLGLMYSPGKHLTLQIDLQWTGMSEIKQWEFNLDPQFYDDYEQYYGYRPDYARHGVDLNLRNTTRFMFGVEYIFKNSIALRAGYTYQKSAATDQMFHPVFLGLDTNILSLGIGYEGAMFSIWRDGEKTGEFSFDVFFQYGFSPSRESALPELSAVYKTNRWNLGVGIGFNWGVLKKS